MSYITFKTLGEAGNLASQMQQYASLYAVAKETGKQIIFPESSIKRGYTFKFAEVLDIDVEVRSDSFFNDFVNIRPNDSVLLDSNIFQLDKDTNYNIENRFDYYGYWHNKYSEDISDWQWRDKYCTIANENYSKVKIQEKETVAIHVRRGDYLLPQHNHFCRLDTDYYGAALKHFFEDIDRYQFLIFSNDIDWCKENLIEESEIVSFIEPGLDYVDLVMMSLCDHVVTANSSYSWWAAYLNKNLHKKVICPTNYLMKFSPWSHLNGNYYPPTWTNINNNN